MSVSLTRGEKGVMGVLHVCVRASRVGFPRRSCKPLAHVTVLYSPRQQPSLNDEESSYKDTKTISGNPLQRKFNIAEIENKVYQIFNICYVLN